MGTRTAKTTPTRGLWGVVEPEAGDDGESAGNSDSEGVAGLSEIVLGVVGLAAEAVECGEDELEMAAVLVGAAGTLTVCSLFL